jgi:hypothetical protein
MNTKTLLEETNHDGLSDQLVTQRPSTSELHFFTPVANSQFFALQAPLRLCCKWSVQNHIFTFAAQEDNPIISSRSPTPDVIEAIPIETQPSTNTNEDHRSHPPTPGPFQTQVHTKTDEPQRSCPPTPDTLPMLMSNRKALEVILLDLLILLYLPET